MKTGRPKLENARTRQYRLRLNDEEYEKLSYLSEKTGNSVSDILRFGVELQYEYAIFSNKNKPKKRKTSLL